MAIRLPPSTLLWGLFLTPGGVALVLRLRALKQRPHQVEGTFVNLHMGFLGTLKVRREQILWAAPLPEFDDDWTRRDYMKGMHKRLRTGAPAVELRLAEAVAGTGLLGPSPHAYYRVAVSVDDPTAFLAALGRPCA